MTCQDAQAETCRSRPDKVAVLFDMDGVLVDSEPVWYEVETALVEGMGGTWSPEHQAKCIGGTVDWFCRYVIELTGSVRSPEDVQDEILAAMAARFADALTIHDGALDLGDGVRTRGARTALVTSSYRALVEPALGWLGDHRFDAVIAGDEVSRGKPDPEPYLAACRALGVEPAAAVVVEDSPSGVRAAEAAGCTVVAVPSVAPIDPGPRRHVVGSVAAIDPEWILSLIR
jgi:HAD superfamily hydrolase (TIGR01509 family)